MEENLSRIPKSLIGVHTRFSARLLRHGGLALQPALVRSQVDLRNLGDHVLVLAAEDEFLRVALDDVGGVAGGVDRIGLIECIWCICGEREWRHCR
jgi:hypothetical protein